MPRNDLIQIRRDTAANWASVNPILAIGEQGFETDTGKFKIGTGSTTWNSLLYATDASDITGATLAVTDDITRGGISLPRGIVAYGQNQTIVSPLTSEAVRVTTTPFTPVANRYYRITYYEPQVATPSSSATASVRARIRITDISGIEYAKTFAQNQVAASTSFAMNTSVVMTLSAVEQVFVGTLEATTIGGGAYRNSINPFNTAYILVEDIGAVNNNSNN